MPSREAGHSEACARAGGKLGRVGCGPVRRRGAAAGWAAPGRAGRERGREKKAGLAGPEGDFLLFFFKSNVYQILFSPFSFLSQIQISFECKISNHLALHSIKTHMIRHECNKQVSKLIVYFIYTVFIIWPMLEIPRKCINRARI